MTIEQMFEKRLFGCGLSENKVKEIMSMVKKAEENKPFERRWEEDEDAYLSQMINLLWFSIKEHILDWIIKNTPKAWYRPLFERKG